MTPVSPVVEEAPTTTESLATPEQPQTQLKERGASKITPEQWRQIVAPAKGADDRRSATQLAVTLAGFFALWALAFLSLNVSYLLTLPLALLAAGFLVRLFMIQHDCGHGSYFRSRRARDLVGFWIGVMTLTPYAYWLRTHAYHHSHAGDLDFRDFGDIQTITRAEYEARSWRGKLAYRLYRNPLILFGFGAAFQFVVKHRYPWDVPRAWKQAWSSVWKTNLALVGVIAVMGFLIGFDRFFLVQVPITFFACSLGVWLFYVQHQFEDSYWHHHDDWNYYDAAIHGSSHLVLPKPLQWMTANIGLHHVHHLNSLIPNYKLQELLDSSPELQQATKITLRQTFGQMKLALWDEKAERLVSFREHKQLLRKTSAA